MPGGVTPAGVGSGVGPARYPADDHAEGWFHVIPAAYVVLRRGREVLLQLRRGTGYMDGYWACAVAGHVEAGESVLAAARREGVEEMGVDLGALHALTVMHRTTPGGGPIEQRVDFFFECHDWVGTPRIREPEKAAEVSWFALDALPDPVVPHELIVLAGLRDGTLAGVTTVGFE